MLAAGCGREEERAEVARPVRLHTIQDTTELSFRSFPGEVVAARTARLSFEVGGRLVEFPITDGQLVSQGDLIGQLDTADFIAARDSAQAAYDVAKTHFERNEALHRRGAVAAAVVDRARQELETADANLRRAARALEETRLTAPFDGRISNRIARELQNVRPQEQVAILEDISALEIEIHIPERDMMLGRRGLTVDDARNMLEAEVEFSIMRDRRLPLDLKTFSSRANPVSRTFLVSFGFDPPQDTNILPGMTGTVYVRRTAATAAPDDDDGPPVRMVPVEAMTTHEGASTVWRLDPESMTVTPIKVEIRSIQGGAAMIVADPLADGDEIVASGARFLAEGTPVRRMDHLQH